MKRLLILAVKAVGWALVLLALACLVTAAVWEAHGIPEWAANAIRAAAADRGLSLTADNIRAGLVRGLVLEHARLRLDRRGTPWVVTCEEVRLQPRLADLARGEFQVQDVSFRGACVSLGLGPGLKSSLNPTALRVERCNGLVQRRRDGVLMLSVDGLAEKVAVHLEAEVDGLEATPLRARGGAGPAPRGGPGPAAGGRDAVSPRPPAEEWLSRAGALLATARFAERDAFLSGRLVVDVRQPRELSFAGEFGLSDLVWGELLVSRLKSALSYRHSEVRLESIRLVTGSGESVTGDVRADLSAAEVSGAVRGRVLPGTLRQLLPEPRPAWLGRLQTGEPLELAVELLPSPLSPARWRLNAEVTARELRLPGLDLSRLTAAGSWDGQDLTVQRWRADLGDAGSEYAEGRLVWHRADSTLEAECLAQCNPGERVRRAGQPAFTRALRGVEFPAAATLRLRLERSPTDWERLCAHATLSAESVRVRGRLVSPLEVEADLDGGLLSLDPIRVGFPDSPADALVLSAAADLSRALASGLWEVRLGLHARAAEDLPAGPSAAPPPWSEAAALHGVVLFTPASGALDATAEGTLCPGRWYASYMPRLGLPASGIVRDIRCAPDAPARVVVTAVRADQRQPLRLRLAVGAEGVRYGELVFRTIQGNIEVVPGHVAFQGVRATTAAGDELALDLALDANPLTVSIRNARVTGNPDVVHAFIEDHDSKAIYRSVWRDFRWSADHPAVVDLHSLIYRQLGHAHAWELSMDADLHAEQATYRDLPLRRLDANVVLDLPDKVIIRTPRIETDTATVEGTVEILTGEDAKCSFAMHQVAGGQDPARILRLLNPDWGTALGPLVFSPDTAVDCRGSFYLNRQPLLQLSGSAQGASLHFHGLQIQAPVAQWGLSGSQVRWNLTSGRLFGGPVAVTGVYDLDAARGTVAFRGDSMAMEQVAEYLDMKREEATQQGQLSAHCRLDILQGWAGRPLQVYGDGNLSLQQADLWRVPFFDQLGRVLDVTFLNRLTGGKASSLGRVTRLDADLGFAGDRVVVRSLATDGTIISLRGHGQYCWETDAIHLSVNGQALDSAGLVGLIFRPLSWAFFNAELTGTARDSKWRLTTALSKALPGGSEAPTDDAPLPAATP